MDDREYRELAKFARQAIVQIDAAEYRSRARQLPRPEDFGLSASDLERITKQTDSLFAVTVWAGGIVLFGLMSWAAHSWLRPVDSLTQWLAVAAIGLFLAGFVGVGLLMVGAVLSLVLSPVLRRLL